MKYRVCHRNIIEKRIFELMYEIKYLVAGHLDDLDSFFYVICTLVLQTERYGGIST